MKRLTNRQLQSIHTRKRIEDAANVCFARKGMAYTLISDIVQEANVSVGTFYHYFKNKDDLLIRQYESFDMEFADRAQELLEDGGAAECLLRFARFFSRASFKQEGRAANLEYLKARPSITLEELWPRNRPYFLVLCTLIARGQHSGQLRRDMPPEEMAELIMMFTRGYNIDWAATDGAYDLRARMDRHLPILLGSLTDGQTHDGPHRGAGYLLPEQKVAEPYRERVRQLRMICQGVIDGLGAPAP
ncbi:MAG: TetR/AcrR family transcriptional regulator [Clostridia bacterium]|nr:TetR/AcrR family transcriptional regulator [Clostridia bacterium]